MKSFLLCCHNNRLIHYIRITLYKELILRDFKFIIVINHRMKTIYGISTDVNWNDSLLLWLIWWKSKWVNGIMLCLLLLLLPSLFVDRIPEASILSRAFKFYEKGHPYMHMIFYHKKLSSFWKEIFIIIYRIFIFVLEVNYIATYSIWACGFLTNLPHDDLGFCNFANQLSTILRNDYRKD